MTEKQTYNLKLRCKYCLKKSPLLKNKVCGECRTLGVDKYDEELKNCQVSIEDTY